MSTSPGALEFDPEKKSTKLIFSGYLQNINKNKISKVPKFPHCANLFTAIIQNGRVFGLKWSRQMRVRLGNMWYIVVFSGYWPARGSLLRIRWVWWPHPWAFWEIQDGYHFTENGYTGALSLASPGVPGNCRKQCSVPGKLPGSTMVVLVGQMGILSAHAWCGTSVKNTMEETIMIVSFAHFILIIKHVL